MSPLVSVLSSIISALIVIIGILSLLAILVEQWTWDSPHIVFASCVTALICIYMGTRLE